MLCPSKGINIMKTPWRFLADLVSRKPAVEPLDKADENASIIALEYRPAQQETATTSGDQAGIDGGAGPHPIRSDVEEIAASEDAPISVIPDLTRTSSSAVSELVSSVAFVEEAVALHASHQSADEEAVSLETKTKNKLRFSAKQANKAERVSTAVADSAKDSVDAAPVTTDTVANEMAELDVEIEALRNQLAKKLRLQNDYLKQLLMRYGGK